MQERETGAGGMKRTERGDEEEEEEKEAEEEGQSNPV